MPGLAASAASAPRRRSSLTEMPAGPLRIEDLALAAELLDQPLGRRVAPLVRVGVDLGGDLVGVDEAVEVDDGDALGAGIGDDAVRRGRRAGDQHDRVDIGVDHRLDLLDLGVGVALGVGDDQFVDQALPSSARRPRSVIVPSVCFIQVGTE